MSLSPKLGFDGRLYYRQNGAGGSGAWIELQHVSDLTLTMNDDDVEATTRIGGDNKQFLPGLREISFEFDMPWDHSNTDLAALITARTARKRIGFTVLDGPIETAGSYGARGDFYLTGMERREQISDAMRVRFTAKPALSDFNVTEITM